MTLRSEVEFGYQRKMVNGTAFPKDKIVAPTNFNGSFSEGILEICIGQNGACHWNFAGQSAGSNKDLSISIPGLDEVITHLQMGNSSLDDFITVVQSKGGILTDLGNKTSSIRLDYPEIERTVITLIDHGKGKILGSSVYKNDRELEAKLICKYSPNTITMQPDELSVLVFEHQVGAEKGWVTEITARTVRR